MLLGILHCSGALAEIGVVKSELSADFCRKNSILNDYNDNFNQVLNNLNYTNLKYKILNENDIDNYSLKRYDVVILPLIYDLPQKTYLYIKNYINTGGKVVIFYSDAEASNKVNNLINLLGVKVASNKKLYSKTSMSWVNGSKLNNNSFNISTKVANMSLNNNSSILGVWNNSTNSFPAVSISQSGSYIGWQWGNNDNTDFNVKTLKYVLDNLVPGIITKEQAPIEYKTLQDKIADIARYRQFTEDYLKLKLPLVINNGEIQEYLYLSQMQEDLSISYYQSGDYNKSLEELKKAKDNAIYAFAEASPSSLVEGRALWLDRGTITSIKNQKQMSELFDKIKNIGINIVYFETINGGYSIYPSKILQQNPQTAGIDPLKMAVEEAHKRGIELHAWTWIFAVGNERLNPILGYGSEYRGPVLTKYKNFTLLTKDSQALLPTQHEYWVDPSNPQARAFIMSVLAEIVKNYDVDGIQFDYIRYPFQSKNYYMGYNAEAKKKFEIESGVKLDKLTPTTIKVWNNWKAKQVSYFVRDASTKLRSLKPDLLISAAVFGGDRDKRMSTIQQDWELWVDNGWVDTLNPMIYATTSDKLLENIEYFKKAVNNKAFIYPGIAVRQINNCDLLDQICMAKTSGLVGSTIFAMAHLKSDKSKILSMGPYKLKQAKIPYKEPLDNSRIFLEQFMSGIKELEAASADEYMINSIMTKADIVHSTLLKTIKNPTSTNIDNTLSSLKELEIYVNNALNSDIKIDKNNKIILISYLDRSITLIAFTQHKKNTSSYTSIK